MNFYKNTLIVSLATSAFFLSCQRYLVVPPPEEPVDSVTVECLFQGLVDTTNYTFQEGMNSYECNMLNSKNIQNSPLPSNAIYSDSLGSSSANIKSGIRLNMGQFVWIDDGSSNPTISEFKNFFSGANLDLQFGDSVNIPYSDLATNGVQIIWYTDNGTPYYSSDTSTYPGTFFMLNNVVYEADNSNEYVKWSALFTCQLWNAAGNDSLVIQNGNFKGAFQRRTQ